MYGNACVMHLCRMPSRFADGFLNFDSDSDADERHEDTPISQRTRRGRKQSNASQPSQKVRFSAVAALRYSYS